MNHATQTRGPSAKSSQGETKYFGVHSCIHNHLALTSQPSFSSSPEQSPKSSSQSTFSKDSRACFGHMDRDESLSKPTNNCQGSLLWLQARLLHAYQTRTTRKVAGNPRLNDTLFCHTEPTSILSL